MDGPLLPVRVLLVALHVGARPQVLAEAVDLDGADVAEGVIAHPGQVVRLHGLVVQL